MSIAQEVKMLLNKHEIPFEERLVTDLEEIQYLKGKGYKTFPIIHDEYDRFIGGTRNLKT